MKKELFTLLTLSLVSIVNAQNAVILHDAYLYGGHSDGSLLIANNVYGSNYEVNQHSIYANALYIGGDNLVTNFLRVNHGASMIVGNIGNYQGQFNYATTPNWDTYRNFSTTLDAYTPTNTFVNNPNNITINLSQGINVFDVKSNIFNDYKTVDFTGDGIVVFNVTGNVNNWSWSVNYDPSKVIFNFIDAERVNINNRQFIGSLIAPNADVTQSQNITGLLVADNWTVNNSAELHFSKCPIIPEPSTTFLGTLGMFFILRRKRS